MITKHCLHCDKNLALTDFQKNRTMKDGLEYWCRDCKAKDHQQRATKRAVNGLCHCGHMRKDGYKTCETCQTRVKEWGQANPQKKKEDAALWRADLRKRVFDYYGRICVCCGEDNALFLTMDHINDDGAEQRKKFGSYNTATGRWTYPPYALIVKQGFPSDLRVLCFNCNCGRQRNGGICPHKSAV